MRRPPRAVTRASILISAEWPIYGRFGYGPAADDADYTIDTRAAKISGRTPEPSSLCELAELRDDAARIYEQFRLTRPGSIEREPLWWDIKPGITPRPGSTEPVQVALRHRTGRTVDGVVRYHVENNWDNRVPNSTFIVDELLAATADAERDLWRFCCELDLVRTIRAGQPECRRAVVVAASRWPGRPPNAPRRLPVGPAPQCRRACSAARSYASAGRLVIEVIDPAGYAAGRFAIDSDGSAPSCRRVKSRPDLTLGVGALGSDLSRRREARDAAGRGIDRRRLDRERSTAAKRCSTPPSSPGARPASRHRRRMPLGDCSSNGATRPVRVERSATACVRVRGVEVGAHGRPTVVA